MNLRKLKCGDKVATDESGQTITFCHHLHGGWCFPVAKVGERHMKTHSDGQLIEWAEWLFVRGLGRVSV